MNFLTKRSGNILCTIHHGHKIPYINYSERDFKLTIHEYLLAIRIPIGSNFEAVFSNLDSMNTGSAAENPINSNDAPIGV